MGFSVTIASSIVLIGLLVIFTSVSVALFQGLSEISTVAGEYLNREREMLNVKLEVEVNGVNADSCNITLKNKGGKTIFLREQNGFQWNTIVFSYMNNSHWLSYTIEKYTVLAVKVSGTNASFDVSSHKFINPGEEALIHFEIPDGAPEIPLQAVVSVAFATHYGVAAEDRGVRES
jgi:archaellum component FlaF (FlaF/FlaG flagellin family)